MVAFPSFPVMLLELYQRWKRRRHFTQSGIEAIHYYAGDASTCHDYEPWRMAYSTFPGQSNSTIFITVCGCQAALFAGRPAGTGIFIKPRPLNSWGFFDARF
jgi:hypothetical protein